MVLSTKKSNDLLLVDYYLEHIDHSNIKLVKDGVCPIPKLK